MKKQNKWKKKQNKYNINNNFWYNNKKKLNKMNF